MVDGELRSAIPAKEDNLFYDLHDLTAFDIAPVEENKLQEVSRDNVQLLVNKLFSQEIEKSETDFLVSLPLLGSSHLPREKQLPKQKVKTRWEKFAEAKGIQKRKRGAMVWDEINKAWAPRWGAKSVKHKQDEANWAIELKPGQDPNECPFEKRKAEKKVVQAKQKLREVRNKAEALGMKLPVGAVSGMGRKDKRGQEHLKETLRRAQKSSASKGKFDTLANGEEKSKERKKKILISQKGEGETYKKMVGKVLDETVKVDKVKAAKWALTEQQKAANANKKGAKRTIKKGKGRK